MSSTHDRGAFGALLAEAKALGYPRLHWRVDLDRPDDDVCRWSAWEENRDARYYGRTGEEALRGLVESFKATAYVLGLL